MSGETCSLPLTFLVPRSRNLASTVFLLMTTPSSFIWSTKSSTTTGRDLVEPCTWRTKRARCSAGNGILGGARLALSVLTVPSLGAVVAGVLELGLIVEVGGAAELEAAAAGAEARATFSLPLADVVAAVDDASAPVAAEGVEKGFDTQVNGLRPLEASAGGKGRSARRARGDEREVRVGTHR